MHWRPSNVNNFELVFISHEGLYSAFSQDDPNILRKTTRPELDSFVQDAMTSNNVKQLLIDQVHAGIHL